MALRRHLRILNGGIEEQRPMTTPVIKVAFATSDRHQVDEHFGAASAMLIYAVTPDQATVIEFAQFGELDQDGHESKLAAKLALLQGCAVVYCQAVGGSAIQQLLALGVQPIRVEAHTTIASLITELQAALRGGHSPAWLNRLIHRPRQHDPAAARFAAMEAEGWRE